jgi:type I restriction enzyme S subunit
VCDIELQTKIIQEIESRLSVCDSIEKTVDTALQQAEAMRQSILKQAFEGRI